MACIMYHPVKMRLNFDLTENNKFVKQASIKNYKFVLHFPKKVPCHIQVLFFFTWTSTDDYHDGQGCLELKLVDMHFSFVEGQ